MVAVRRDDVSRGQPEPLQRIEKAKLQLEACFHLGISTTRIGMQKPVRMPALQIVVGDERCQVEERIVVASVFPVE